MITKYANPGGLTSRSYAHFRDRYRDMASALGFEAHIALKAVSK